MNSRPRDPLKVAARVRTPLALRGERPLTAMNREYGSDRVCRVAAVPRISVFYGVVIAMYFSDHPPPHFHARYAEYEAVVGIATGRLLNGALPPRARRMVEEWAGLHRTELESNWLRAVAEEPLSSIDPLP